MGLVRELPRKLKCLKDDAHTSLVLQEESTLPKLMLVCINRISFQAGIQSNHEVRCICTRGELAQQPLL
jgi:hypothetical protein